MAHYGLRGVVLDWFKNYLSNREQFVDYNNHTSAKRTINSGMPQGSILGPFMSNNISKLNTWFKTNKLSLNLLSLYHTLVLSHINYGITAWNSEGNVDKNRLHILQNNVL